MWSYARLLPIVALSLACNKIDRLLEGTDVYDGSLAVAVASPTVTLAQGKEITFAATVTQTGTLKTASALSVEGVPQGVNVTIGTPSTSGNLTTIGVTLKVAAGAQVGSYLLTVRARAEPSAVAAALLTLTVTAAPAFTLSVSSTELRITHGGIAPLGVKFARTNLTEPITLALSGSGGVAASFQANPVSGDSTAATISVPASTAPGTYPVTLRATATGVPDQSAQLSVIVTSDPIQLIASPRVSVGQGATTQVPIVVNRSGYSGAVSLTVENLPSGVTGTFDPASPPGGTSTLSLVVAPTASPGAYSVRLTGAGTGVPDATATIELVVTPVNVSLSASPRELSVFQGSSASLTTVKIVRTGFTGPVALSVEGAPPGISVVVPSAKATDDSVTANVTAAASASPGRYDVTIRGAPPGFPLSGSTAAAFSVTVRAAPPGGGNVILDWSRCAPPDWVAYIDGAGEWAQAPVASGVARFTIASSRGGIAYVEGGAIVAVRFGLQAEFIDKPLDMCPAPVQTKNIIGSVSFGTQLDQMSFVMGGASATASGSSPHFTLAGVKDGPQDLLGWGQLSLFGRRGILRRDVDLASGESVGVLDPLGIEAFVPEPASLSINGTVQGDQLSHIMYYMTTPACVANVLYQATFTSMLGVPSGIQRETDYHMVSLVATAGSRQRTANLTFHTIANRSITLPPIPSVPAVSSIPGSSYRRLQAFVNTLAQAYNGNVMLRYNDGSTRTMSVSASAAYVAIAGSTLIMPNFSGVSGWLNNYAVDPNASGTWVVSLDGATQGPACSEGKVSYLTTQTGRF